MDVKSAFLYGKIDEEVYVSQPPGFLDPKSPQKVYKVVKALYGLHQAPKSCFKSTPKTYHLTAVICCQKEFLDSDYAGAVLTEILNNRRCQFLGRRLISMAMQKSKHCEPLLTTEVWYMLLLAKCCGHSSMDSKSIC
ncbi:ribonuclease H-like domain, reverse transcriptase, RNA-dependent DNA polymerase [Tanacetum coccineum]